MVKKIYDIVPGEKQNSSSEDESCYSPRKKKSKFSLLPLILIVFIVIIAALYFVFPGKADVVIYPKTEDISVTSNITIDSSTAVIDYTNSIVPGIIFPGDDKKVYTDSYQSTGTGDNVAKATGKIRVYSKLTEPISLIKGTRFLSSAAGLTYRADSGFTVPAAKSDGTPGTVDISVTADASGTQYNIKSETFSVPGLSGKPEYYSLSAQTISGSPISGGQDSQVKIASKDDISSAKDKFQNKYSDVAKQALIATIPQGYEYSADDIVPSFDNIVVSANQGDQVDTFTVSSTISTQVLVYRKDDVNKLGETLLKGGISELKTIVPDSISYTINSKTALKGGKMQMAVTFNAKTYSMPDNNLLMSSLEGKDKNYSISVLENDPDVQKVEIKLSPIWQLQIPNDSKKINILTKF